MRRKTKIILTTVLLVVIVPIAIVSFALYKYINQAVPDAYAVWNVADAVNVYLDTHDGAWPRQWDDLRKTMQATEHPWNEEHFADLKNRVEVNWNADPRLLAQSPDRGTEPPVHVIWLRDGTHSYWNGAEPNRLVWSHLREKSAQTRPSSDDVGSAPRTLP